MQPGIPWTDHSAGVVDCNEPLEIRFDAPAHILMELPLLGTQVGLRHEGQSHGEFLRWFGWAASLSPGPDLLLDLDTAKHAIVTR